VRYIHLVIFRAKSYKVDIAHRPSEQNRSVHGLGAWDDAFNMALDDAGRRRAIFIVWFMAKSYNADITHRPTVPNRSVCDIYIVWFSGQELQRRYRTSTSCSNRSVYTTPF